MLYCFANRQSFDENSNSMDEKFFQKKIEVTRFTWRLSPITTIEGQSRESVNINREYFLKSYKKVFNCLMVSLESKSAFNWSNTLQFFKKLKG